MTDLNQENGPLVSVIVPSYNHEKYVKDTIESILNQTYKNIELIVIDDGSKDNSPRILEELSKKHGFLFIHRPNKGLTATLNEALKLAKGKYICFCASDDMYLPHKIEKQVKFMEENPEYGMCHGNVKFLKDERIIDNKKKPEKEIDFEELLMRDPIFAVTVMVRKEVFDKVGPYDESLYVDDWDMWLRIAFAGFRIGYIDDYLAIYRLHETNMTKNWRIIQEDVLKILNKWKSHPKYKLAIKRRQLICFNGYAVEDKRRALKYLPTALGNLPNPLAIKGIIKLILPKSVIIFSRKIRKVESL